MEITEKISEVLKDLCDAEIIEPSLNLREDLMLDSLMMVSLIIGIEEKFDIEFDESDMDPMDLVYVNDLLTLVNKYMGDYENEEEGK